MLLLDALGLIKHYGVSCREVCRIQHGHLRMEGAGTGTGESGWHELLSCAAILVHGSSQSIGDATWNATKGPCIFGEMALEPETNSFCHQEQQHHGAWLGCACCNG